MARVFEEAKHAQRAERKRVKAEQNLRSNWNRYVKALRKEQGEERFGVFADMTAWLGLLSEEGRRKDSIVMNRDGTIDGQVMFRGIVDIQDLTERVLPAVKNLHPEAWIRVGFRYEIDADSRDRYDGLKIASVQTGWYRRERAVAMMLCNEDITRSMTGDEYGHRIVGAIVTIHYNPDGSKPDRR